jgi:tetratricopeptide (TPR) repeat protein
MLGVARRADPHPWRDRFRDPDLWGSPRRLEQLAAQARVEELSPQAAVALAWALRGDRAVGLLRGVQRRHPADFWVNFTLGTLLKEAKKHEEASGYLRAALAVRPTAYAAYVNLGNALADKGEVGEAIACYQRAIAADPKLAQAHYNLGLALYGKGDVEGAIACYLEAIKADPQYAHSHYNLGVALNDKGNADEAIACYRKAIALDPKHAKAHTNLGVLLKGKGQLEEAIACYRKAIAAEPKLAEAHCNLGHAFRDKGSFREALGHLKAGHQLGSRRRGWPYPSAAWVKEAQRLVQLDGKLREVLRGKARPRDAAERLALAGLAQQPSKREYAAAARFYAEAFAQQPDLAKDLASGRRYNATCSAALAGCAQGKDARALSVQERRGLRRRALTWLRAELRVRAGQLAGEQPQARRQAQSALRHWQVDPDLAGLRDPEALKGRSAEERQTCQRLWADVRDLLAKATGAEEK